MTSVENAEILLLEDNQTDVQLLREALTENDIAFTLRDFSDGELIVAEARNCAAGHALPDLIVLDLNVPRMEGLDALQEIRQIPELAHTPVVILTSSGFTQDRVSAAIGGADSYLQKPVSYQAYLEEIGPAIKAILKDPLRSLSKRLP